ncbi:MAG: hypothetical protein V7636_1385, partial [Actinomycetota bacterium]
MLLSLRPPSDEWLARIVDEESSRDVTYAAVGATVSGEHPAG